MNGIVRENDLLVMGSRQPELTFSVIAAVEREIMTPRRLRNPTGHETELYGEMEIERA